MQPKILLTGRSGQVGYELLQTLSPLGDVWAVDVHDVDLADASALERFVRKINRLDLIVNPAAFTAVDLAEDQPDLARAINAAAPRILAAEAARRNIPIIHYSTDYVFDGKRSPGSLYMENDVAEPLTCQMPLGSPDEKASPHRARLGVNNPIDYASTTVCHLQYNLLRLRHDQGQYAASASASNFVLRSMSRSAGQKLMPS
jgi:nucleoside-diphosphate-sugar epimerase